MMREMYEDASSRMEAQDSRGGEEVRGVVDEYKSGLVGFAAQAGVPPVDEEVRSDNEMPGAERDLELAIEGRGSHSTSTTTTTTATRRNGTESHRVRRRDSSSSREPSLSSGDSSRGSETDLDENETPGSSLLLLGEEETTVGELDLQGLSVLERLEYIDAVAVATATATATATEMKQKKKRGDEADVEVEVDEKYFYENMKVEPTVTVLDVHVPGAWRW